MNGEKGQQRVKDLCPRSLQTLQMIPTLKNNSAKTERMGQTVLVYKSVVGLKPDVSF